MMSYESERITRKDGVAQRNMVLRFQRRRPNVARLSVVLCQRRCKMRLGSTVESFAIGRGRR